MASLSILLPSLSIKMIGGLANHLCQATEHEKKLPPLLLGAALTNVGINFLLIPRLGSPGAALATFISECILTTLTLILIRKIGYKQIGIRLGWLTIFSLVVTGTPSLLIFTPLPLGVGIALILGGCAAIFALMRPNQFMRLDSPQVTVN
ncbi:MAG: polysaccharide biosynthesis C-terminal domain-containing protein [Microcoleaceae cyanobacterium]